MSTEPVEPQAVTHGEPSMAVQAAALREVVTGMTAALTHNRMELQSSVRLVRVMRNVLVVVLVTFAVAIGGGLYFGLQTHDVLSKVRATQLVGRQTSVSNQALSKQIADCVTPGRPCYDRNLKNQQVAITSIVDTNHNGKADTQEILELLRQLVGG